MTPCLSVLCVRCFPTGWSVLMGWGTGLRALCGWRRGVGFTSFGGGSDKSANGAGVIMSSSQCLSEAVVNIAWLPPRIALRPPAANMALDAAAAVLARPGFQRGIGKIRAESMLRPHQDRKDRRGAHCRVVVNPSLPLFSGERICGRGAMEQIVGGLGFDNEQSHDWGWMRSVGVRGMPTAWQAPRGPGAVAP